ncbi:hypothetical protein PO909_007304 [Leuciscus waleckii]
MIRVSVTDAKLKKVQGKISRELSKKIIVSVSDVYNVLFQKAQCESSYREVNSQTFVQNFQTLLQKVSSRQSHLLIDIQVNGNTLFYSVLVTYVTYRSNNSKLCIITCN